MSQNFWIKFQKNLSPVTDYVDGLISGKLQYELDQERTRLEELHRPRNTSKDRDLELE